MSDEHLREVAAKLRIQSLGLLRTFASPAELRDYQQAVLFISVPKELVCGWSDDFYHPDTAAHELAFSPAEREALARFDAEFHRWVDAVDCDLEAFIASPAGRALAQAATLALKAFAQTPAPTPGAFLVYCEARMLLDRGRYGSWRDIQDAYPDYKASLGPWSEADIVEFLAIDFGTDDLHWPFTRQAIAEFFRSGDQYLVCSDEEPGDAADSAS